MNCPKCGGPMNDVRGSKRSPRSPDFVCQNTDGCGKAIKGKWYTTAVWEEKNGNGSPQGGQQSTPAAPRQPKWTWPTLSLMYQRCLALASKHVNEHVKDSTSADIVAAAATLFITATRDGVEDRPKPTPAPPPVPANADAEDDDDLPF